MSVLLRFVSVDSIAIAVAMNGNLEKAAVCRS